MPLFQLIFSYFLGLLLSLLIFYGVGKFIRRIWSGSFSFQFFFFDIFFNLLVGQIAIVFFYAIYHTKGLTIQWLFLLIAFFFWKERNITQKSDNQKFTFKSAAPKLLAIFIGIIFCFSWEAYFFIDTDGFPFRIPFIDTGFYNKVSYFLSVTGSENTANMENWLEGQPSGGISLYHYFELWLNNIITNSLGLLSMPTYVLITQPSFFVIGFVGILALLEQKAQFNFLHLFWAILLLFSGVVFFDFYPKIEKLQYIGNIYFYFLGHISKKTGTYYVCAIAFALLYERKQYKQAFYALFCLPIMTVTMLTSIIGGVWLFCLAFWFKKDSRADATKILFSSILFFVLFLSAYNLIKDNNALLTLKQPLSQLSFFHSLLLTKLKLIVGTLAQVILLFMPYIIIILFNNPIKIGKLIYNNHFYFIVASFSIVIAGMVSWALFFGMSDSFQLFIGTLSILSTLIVVLIISYVDIFNFTKLESIAANLFLVSILLYNIFQQSNIQKHQYSNWNNHFNSGQEYSTIYLNKVQKAIYLYKIKGFGGCLINNDILDRSPHIFYIKLGDYLHLMIDSCFTVSLNDLNRGNIEDSKASFTNVLPFYKFAKKQQQEGTFQSIAQSQVDFIKKYKLKFLILSKNIALSELFTPLIQEIIVDESSGERFIILKSNEN